MKTFATLKPNDELREVFPDGTVPIVSVVPFVPRQEGCPLCYKVNSKELTTSQIEYLAHKLLKVWYLECHSLQQAIDYIVEGGLPLRCDRFSSVSTTDYAMLPFGAAVACAMMSSTEPEEDF